MEFQYVGAAGGMVESVDILSNEEEFRHLAFQLYQGEVAGVGLEGRQ
jgi:hypothetical protein